MATKTNKTKTSSYIIAGVLAIIAIAGISFGVFVLVRQIRLQENPRQNDTQNTNTADTPLRTEEDLQDDEKVAEASNDAKDRMEADDNVTTTVEKDQSGLIIARPEISYVAIEDDNIVAGGQIPNINETEGTCTYVFTKGSTTVTESAEILPNPSYISCAAVRIAKTKFSAGEWNVKILYKSNTAEGESASQSITIQ